MLQSFLTFDWLKTRINGKDYEEGLERFFIVYMLQSIYQITG